MKKCVFMLFCVLIVISCKQPNGSITNESGSNNGTGTVTKPSEIVVFDGKDYSYFNKSYFYNFFEIKGLKNGRELTKVFYNDDFGEAFSLGSGDFTSDYPSIPFQYILYDNKVPFCTCEKDCYFESNTFSGGIWCLCDGITMTNFFIEDSDIRLNNMLMYKGMNLYMKDGEIIIPNASEITKNSKSDFTYGIGSDNNLAVPHYSLIRGVDKEGILFNKDVFDGKDVLKITFYFNDNKVIEDGGNEIEKYSVENLPLVQNSKLGINGENYYNFDSETVYYDFDSTAGHGIEKSITDYDVNKIANLHWVFGFWGHPYWSRLPNVKNPVDENNVRVGYYILVSEMSEDYIKVVDSNFLEIDKNEETKYYIGDTLNFQDNYDELGRFISSGDYNRCINPLLEDYAFTEILGGERPVINKIVF